MTLPKEMMIAICDDITKDLKTECPTPAQCELAKSDFTNQCELTCKIKDTIFADVYEKNRSRHVRTVSVRIPICNGALILSIHNNSNYDVMKSVKPSRGYSAEYCICSGSLTNPNSYDIIKQSILYSMRTNL